MRRPRMTTRRWMVAVAVVAVAFGGEVLRRRSIAHQSRAKQFALYEAQARRSAESSDRYAAERGKYLREIQDFAGSGGGAFRASWKPLVDTATEKWTRASEQADRLRRSAAHWGALRAKYERAARRPWLSVEPDPPAP